jgi:F-type H+-transporting ATPase subunit a
MNNIARIGFELPPINMLLRWQDVLPTGNKVVLIGIAAALIGIGIFLAAARKDPKQAPKGSRNLAEVIIEFIEKQIILQTMGPSGLAWTPFLLTLFIFIYISNVPGIIPIIQMPATARMGTPAALALIVWIVYNATGIRHQGPLGYFKSVLFPPGVPKALYILITPIEFISTFIVRPFSLAIRLFANMLAGHLLLVIFSLLSEALFQARCSCSSRPSRCSLPSCRRTSSPRSPRCTSTWRRTPSTDQRANPEPSRIPTNQTQQEKQQWKHLQQSPVSRQKPVRRSLTPQRRRPKRQPQPRVTPTVSPRWDPASRWE